MLLLLHKLAVIGLSALLLSAFLPASSSQLATQAADAGVYTVVRSELTEGEDGPLVESQALSAAAYVVNTNLWDATSLPVKVALNARSAPEGIDMAALLQAGISTWNSTPSAFAFAPSGTPGGDGGSCDSVIHLDGVNSVTFAPLDGKLGLTCTVYLGTGASNKLVEFDLILASDPGLWSTEAITPAGKFDLASTLLHELGHATGLGHGAAGTVMDGTLATGTQRRALTASDRAGLLAAYPAPAVVAAASLPSPFTGMYRLRAAVVAHD
jgi:hypothetical protein